MFADRCQIETLTKKMTSLVFAEMNAFRCFRPARKLLCGIVAAETVNLWTIVICIYSIVYGFFKITLIVIISISYHNLININ